jgi:signal transduction histidine kinase
MIDLQGKLKQINPAGERQLGVSATNLGHQTWLDFIHPEDQQIAQIALQALTPEHDTVSFQVHDGNCQTLNWRLTLRAEEQLIYAIGTPTTPSGINHCEAEQQQAALLKMLNQKVERMKDEFVAVVSHELRTPLTSIHGSLGLLASGMLEAQPEKRDRLVQIAVTSTAHLVRLVNDILDIEQMASGQITLVKRDYQVADLMLSAVRCVQPLADQAGITISVELLDAPLWVDGDRIIQLFTNLLNNAIKFLAPGGTVWFTAERQADQVLVQVRDRGCGIPPDKLDHIFERFHQVDASVSRYHEGPGLGLAMCRSIVQQHAGTIWAESVLGEGSLFSLTLPIAQQENPDGY